MRGRVRVRDEYSISSHIIQTFSKLLQISVYGKSHSDSALSVRGMSQCKKCVASGAKVTKSEPKVTQERSPKG